MTAGEDGRRGPAGPGGSTESEKERLNRKLAEFLQELRVVLPGVQVLFAFLLAIPFASGFERIDRLDRAVYFGTFLAAALASVFLIAPSAYHRMRWRYTDLETLDEKRRMLVTAGRLAVAGIVSLGITMTGVAFLIGHVLFDITVAVIVSGILGASVVWFWYGLPLVRRFRDASDGPSTD